ncbi:MAG: LytTR family transcriptional regulator, partial [Bacteroidetes bacterium]
MEKRLFIKSGKVYHRIKIDEVLYILTEGNYSTFYTSGSKYTAKISLKNAGEIIPSDIFIRVHRNY